MRNVTRDGHLYFAEREELDRPDNPAPGDDVRGVDDADDFAADDDTPEEDDEGDEGDEGSF